MTSSGSAPSCQPTGTETVPKRRLTSGVLTGLSTSFCVTHLWKSCDTCGARGLGVSPRAVVAHSASPERAWMTPRAAASRGGRVYQVPAVSPGAPLTGLSGWRDSGPLWAARAVLGARSSCLGAGARRSRVVGIRGRAGRAVAWLGSRAGPAVRLRAGAGWLAAVGWAGARWLAAVGGKAGVAPGVAVCALAARRAGRARGAIRGRPSRRDGSAVAAGPVLAERGAGPSKGSSSAQESTPGRRSRGAGRALPGAAGPR